MVNECSAGLSVSVLLSQLFSQISMRWDRGPTFSSVHSSMTCEFDGFVRFTPGPEYQSLSTLTYKARPPLPGMSECSFTEGLN